MGMGPALDTYFENAMLSVHTTLPGEVVKYDAEKHRAQVKPVLNLLMSNGVQIELPELLDVPVMFPSAASFDLEFPLDKGDPVMLVFQEQDISAWKAGDKGAKGTTSSRFNLDAAVALPGLYSAPTKGKARIYVDEKGVLHWQAKKIVFDGQLVVHNDLIVRGDVFVGVGTGPGFSALKHIHPSGAGPTSQPTPNTPIPAEEN